MRRRAIPELLVGAAAMTLLAASTVGFLTRAEGGDGAPGAAGGPGSVAIAGFRFGPGTTNVAVGDAVTWTNDDDFAHNVTSVDDGPLDSGEIAGGATYRAAFDAPGTFAYRCTLHPNMEGTVEVAA